MREPIGYFLLERGADGAPLTDAQLKAPCVVGQTIRVPWSAIHESPGVFVWDEIDARLAQCKRTGRLAKLIIQTGRGGMSPRWLTGQWITDGPGNRAPAPWSPEALAAWEGVIWAAGRRYAANTSLVGVHATGPTWPSAEMHPCPRLETKYGYSKAAMVAAWDRAIRATARAFPDVAVCLSISVQRPADKYVRDVIGHANEELGPRLRIQHNALKADTNATAAHHALVADCHRLGIDVGFEMACTVKDSGRFGSRKIMDGITIGKLAGGRYFDVYPQPEDISGLRI